MKERIFVNAEAKAIMCFSKTMGCWCCYFIKKDGNINKRKAAVYGFDNSRSKSITLMRKETKVPHEGWEKHWINTRKLSMNEVCKEAWNINQKISA
jgi:hypothetical protein